MFVPACTSARDAAASSRASSRAQQHQETSAGRFQPAPEHTLWAETRLLTWSLKGWEPVPCITMHLGQEP